MTTDEQALVIAAVAAEIVAADPPIVIRERARGVSG
jgi:hypothetical protein